jgi:hypothetical protein
MVLVWFISPVRLTARAAMEYPMRNRKRLLKSTAILALLTVLLPLTAFPASGQQNPVASLDPIQGLIQYRAANAAENDWQTVTQTQLVSEGDWIRTDSLGEANLTFFEGVQTEVLPNIMMQVGKFQVSEQKTFDISLNVAIGDMHNQIQQVLDPQSHFEINTPSAAITVRGTDFWVSASWLSESLINTVMGSVAVMAILPNGQFGNSVFVSQGQSVNVDNNGNIGPLGPLSLPPLPPSAPLAPATCGNGVCDPGEENVCSLDCQQFPNCGDQTCDIAHGEGPVTCPQDCIPAFRQTSTQLTGGQPCTVMTTQNNVPMRVGPGLNRGVRDYLKPNTSFPVLGQDQAPDGSLWWQIQVPGVAEAWVLQSDVTSSGECQNVGQSAAPPLILPHPTAVPTQEGQPSGGPTEPPMSISFYADSYTTSPGKPVTITWSVDGIKEVYFQGVGVTGHESRVVYPRETTTYTLTVITLDGQTITRTLTIQVPYIG